MDALAQGYGSDSSSDDESTKNETQSQPQPKDTTSNNNNNNNKDDNDNTKKKKKKRKSSSLNLLGAHYSDDDESSSSCDSDSDEDVKTKKKQNDRKGPTNNDVPNNKKQKLNNIKEPIFPTPRLLQSSLSSLSSSDNQNSNPKRIESNNNPFESLVLFPRDYLTPLIQKQQQQKIQLQDPIKYKALSTKLDTLYHQFHGQMQASSSSNSASSCNTNTFANHLKNQKEFGNPHLFPSIITHFGIDSRGSNDNYNSLSLCNNNDEKNSSSSGGGNKNGVMNVKFGKFEYIEKIVPKEEENRIRDANNALQP